MIKRSTEVVNQLNAVIPSEAKDPEDRQDFIFP
jgi:hypothetical protein